MIIVKHIYPNKSIPISPSSSGSGSFSFFFGASFFGSCFFLSSFFGDSALAPAPDTTPANLPTPSLISLIKLNLLLGQHFCLYRH